MDEAIDQAAAAEDYGYSSDSDLEDDEDEKVSSFKQGGKGKRQQFDPFAIPGEEKVVYEECKERIEKERVIRIPDVAFVTWVPNYDILTVVF